MNLECKPFTAAGSYGKDSLYQVILLLTAMFRAIFLVILNLVLFFLLKFECIVDISIFKLGGDNKTQLKCIK